MRAPRRWAPALVAFALWLVSPSAMACAVCGGGGQNRQAFLDTMVFLSLMPLLGLGVFGGVVWYLAKKAQEAERADALAAQAVPVASEPR
ncbi:MAG: hypothetical protein R3F61_05550 [Myxococcota bacterium]